MQVTIKNVRKDWRLKDVCPYMIFADVNVSEMPCIGHKDDDPPVCDECRAAYMHRLTFQEDGE